MLSAETLFSEMINNPVRSTRARLEILEGTELIDVCKCGEELHSLTIDRVGDTNKFFGFGVCHKLNAKMLDTKRQRNFSTSNILDVAFGVGTDYIHPFPYFYITDVFRDEKTNQLSITAYDALYEAGKHTVAELNISNYTLKEYAMLCGGLIGVAVKIVGVNDAVFNTHYENGANLDGTETIREVLNAIAEATQTIYYINSEGVLTFKRLDKDGEALLTIDREKYFTLDSGENRRLAAITHTTELGDNLTAKITQTGTTQYIRDNPFYELREDIGTLLDNAISAVGGFTINQFDCSWRGNYLLEIGDKIKLITKDGGSVYSFLLDDTISFDGSLSEKTKWKYSGSDTETNSNPTTIGDAINQTFAKVDKVNKEIELVASETSTNAENISSLLINTESISASVEAVRTETENAFGVLNENVSTLTSRVETAVSAEQVQLSIQTELEKGTNKVITETGFTFDETGLTVSRTGSEMATQITDDGMTVSKDGNTMLTANNVGVNAVNLHATTYLIIGTNSRFENYGDNRTGCFWIGS